MRSWPLLASSVHVMVGAHLRMCRGFLLGFPELTKIIIHWLVFVTWNYKYCEWTDHYPNLCGVA